MDPERCGGGATTLDHGYHCFHMGRFFVTDEIEQAFDRMKPGIALYVGGMGHRDKNFHNYMMVRRGYPEAAQKIQELYLAGRKREAIEAVHGRNPAPHIPALARHYRLAGAAADLDKALDYSLRAGETAVGVFAWEEAAEHWQAALELMEDEGVGGVKWEGGDGEWYGFGFGFQHAGRPGPVHLDFPGGCGSYCTHAPVPAGQGDGLQTAGAKGGENQWMMSPLKETRFSSAT